jgi:cytochrome c-type biogenesis protein CcmE
MTHKALKIGVTVVVLGLAFAALLRSSLSEGTEYYKHVDEVMTNPAQWQGKRLQLHGFVVRDSIFRKQNSLDYRFQIANNGKSILANYTGIVPDTFKDEAEVVLKGRLGPDGFQVDPNGVMAKCPSKYEPKKSVTAAPGT